MSVIYSDGLQETRMQAVADAIGSTGVFEIATRAVVNPQNLKDIVPAITLAAFPLDGVPQVDGSTLIMNLLDTETQAVESGIAAFGQVRTVLGFLVVSRILAGFGAPAGLILNSLDITAGQTIRLQFLRISHSQGTGDELRARMTLRSMQ